MSFTEANLEHTVTYLSEILLTLEEKLKSTVLFGLWFHDSAIITEPSSWYCDQGSDNICITGLFSGSAIDLKLRWNLASVVSLK